MTRFVLLFSGILMSFFSFSQNLGFCGTQMPEEMISWLKDYKQNPKPTFKQGGDSSLYYIPLKIHIVGNDQGGGYYPTATLLDALCRLNEQFIPVGFHFYLFETINYINNQTLYEHTGNIGTIINNTKDPRAANIYFVQDPDGNCGYFSGWRDFIAIAKSCAGSNNSTIAHELGHYFDLPHTFYGWENRSATDAASITDERVNGSNCSTSGDFFCDTPADYLSDRWQCPYNRTKTDYNGDQYTVDGSLFMSYANDACQQTFSAEQIDVMRSYLVNERQELLDNPKPTLDSVGQTAAVYPPAGYYGVPANYAQLKWRKAEGATHYNLLVTRYFNGSFNNVDIITADTSYLIENLDPNVNYRWRVRPFNAANTCSGYTVYSTFVTVGPTTIVPDLNVINVSCPGNGDGAIQIAAVGDSGPYSYTWSNGHFGPQMTGLLPGTYKVTINNNSFTDSLILSVDILEPKILDVSVSEIPYGLLATGIGGTPPYTFMWSDGSTAATVNIQTPSQYIVTITDSRGCTSQKNYFFTSISEPAAVAETRVYPNPLNTGEELVVEFNVSRSFTGNISLFDFTGKMISALEKDFVQGNHAEKIVIPQLSSGIYILKFQGPDFNIQKKVVVL